MTHSQSRHSAAPALILSLSSTQSLNLTCSRALSRMPACSHSLPRSSHSPLAAVLLERTSPCQKARVHTAKSHETRRIHDVWEMGGRDPCVQKPQQQPLQPTPPSLPRLHSHSLQPSSTRTPQPRTRSPHLSHFGCLSSSHSPSLTLPQPRTRSPHP